MPRATPPFHRGPVAVALAATLVPAVAAVAYVHAFGVNVPFADTYNGLLPALRAFASGHLTLSDLWVPHNENRMLFPNLLVVLVDSHTRMDSKVDMYLGAALVIAGTVVLSALAGHTGRLPAWTAAPLPFLLLSLVQSENYLWAFQVAWFLIVLCLAGALAALEGLPRRPWLLAVAAGLAVVGSFSSLQGLLIWPAGLVYLLLRGAGNRVTAAWCALGAASGAVYFWQFSSPALRPSLGYILREPAQTVKYGLILVGSIFPAGREEIGALVLLLLVAAVYIAHRCGVGWPELRLPLALATFAVLFDLLVVLGRAVGNQPTSSRYTTYNILLLAAIYLLGVRLLEHWRAAAVAGRGHTALLPAVAGVAAVLCLLQIGLSVPAGLKQGRLTRSTRQQGAALLRDFRQVSNQQLAQALFPPSGPYVRYWAVWLQQERWSVFAPR